MAARIVEVQRAAYAVEAELIGFDRIPPLLEAPEDVARLDVVFLGLVVDGRVEGLLGYRRVADVIDIDRLAVRPTSFRRGIGRTLVEDLHRREADADRLEVSTAASNHPALALYRRLGYLAQHTSTVSGLVIDHLARAMPTPPTAGVVEAAPLVVTPHPGASPVDRPVTLRRSADMQGEPGAGRS